MDVTFKNARHALGAMLASLLILTGASAADSTLTISGPETQPIAGKPTSFWLNALNTSTQEISWIAPTEINCELRAGQNLIPFSAKLQPTTLDGAVRIAPGTFARREYVFQMPETVVGEATIEFTNLVSTTLMLKVQKPEVDNAETPKRGLLYFFKGRKQAESTSHYDPQTFFKQHIFGYQPFYFVAGTESPNAKFQISFKYRLLNEDGSLAELAPWLTGLNVAYSQTSLWDWNGDSAPFYDSSYRPEILYAWENLFGGGPTNWFRMDIQTGLQHESNGKDGDDSRSLNIVYLNPTFTFGKDSGLQLKLSPRTWIYVGDMSDNRDMPDYRGYVDLRGVLGWKRGLQLSALGRMGNHYDHASGQFDLTYPLMQPPSGSFSVYLQVQYFIGYGESLLGYRERTDIIRAGFSLFR